MQLSLPRQVLAILCTALSLSVAAQESIPASPAKPAEQPAKESPTNAPPKAAGPTPIPAVTSSPSANPNNRLTVAGMTTDQENAFALSLVRQLAAKTDAAKLDNAILCPGGVTRLLRALDAGAKGRTATELAKALGLDPTASSNSPQAGPAANTGNVMKVASAIWCDPSYPFLPNYQQAIEETFGAHAANVPLLQSSEKARATINSWASENTGGHIPELLKPGDLHNARLVLTDAAWFKDSWKQAFKPEDTNTAEFTLPDGRKRTVAFVGGIRPGRVGTTADAQVLALPFATARYECLCVLPIAQGKETPGAALLRFERTVKPETFAALNAALAEQKKIDIRLPKLDLKGLSATLMPPLQGLGIKTAFSKGADFSGMTATGKDLKIGLFKQETAFRLDETGAEATAATAAGLMTKSVAAPIKPVVFHADRPCLFLVRDTETGGLVFIIRCAAPADAAKTTPSAAPAGIPAVPDHPTPSTGKAAPPPKAQSPTN